MKSPVFDSNLALCHRRRINGKAPCFDGEAKSRWKPHLHQPFSDRSRDKVAPYSVASVQELRAGGATFSFGYNFQEQPGRRWRAEDYGSLVAAFPEYDNFAPRWPKAKRMPETENRNLREWITELRPNATWFLLTLIGSAVAAEIVSWIPDPGIRAIVIGIGLCINALLIAWLSWLRTRDNKATTRELTILLQRIEKLQKASVDIGRQRQQREQPHPEREQPRPRISSLAKSHPDVVEPLSRTGFEDTTTSPRWGIGEQDAHRQWKLLNASEKAIVRFVLLKGTATAAQLLQFRDPGGFRPTDTFAEVRQKTSFLLGDLQSGLTINPQLKAYLEKIIGEDKSRGTRF